LKVPQPRFLPDAPRKPGRYCDNHTMVIFRYYSIVTAPKFVDRRENSVDPPGNEFRL